MGGGRRGRGSQRVAPLPCGVDLLAIIQPRAVGVLGPVESAELLPVQPLVILHSLLRINQSLIRIG